MGEGKEGGHYAREDEGVRGVGRDSWMFENTFMYIDIQSSSYIFFFMTYMPFSAMCSYMAQYIYICICIYILTLNMFEYLCISILNLRIQYR